MPRTTTSLFLAALLLLCASCASPTFFHHYRHEPTPEEKVRMGCRWFAPTPEPQSLYTVHRIAPKDAPRLFMFPFWEDQAWNPAELGFLSHAWPTSKYKGARIFFKMLHDGEQVYVIFYGYDRYMLGTTFRDHSPTYRDTTVEFFASPAGDQGGYFNIEASITGTYLAQIHPLSNFMHFHFSLLKSPVAVYSDVGRIIANEVKQETEWCVAFVFKAKDILQELGLDDTAPLSGQTWQANLYHCAEASSHPRWFSWAPLQKRNFHRREDFKPMFFE